MLTDKAFWILWTILLVLTLMMGATTLDAQGRNCGDPGVIGTLLADRWGESVQMRGLAENGSLVEVWGNAATGTWTITVTAPGGPACLVASGQAFDPVADPLPNTDEGA